MKSLFIPPYQALALGKRDVRSRTSVGVRRILWQTEGDQAPLHPEILVNSKEEQAYVHGLKSFCVMKPGSALLLDFGMEIHGGARFITGPGKPSTGTPAGDRGVYQLRLRFGESVGEVMGTPNNDHSVHDTHVDLAAMGSTEIGNTGFRFIHIQVPKDAPELPLLSVHAILILLDLPYRGQFRSSDERLNQIWAVGAHTVHLNMQDYLWDGIHRDRLVWMGDLNPEIRVIAAVFDECDLVEKSLDFVRDRTNGEDFMNGISTYSAWWVINQWEWHLFRGNRAYLESQRGYLLPLLERLHAMIQNDGSENFPGWRFLDWPSNDQPAAVHAGLQGLLLMAMQAGEKICRILGEDRAAEACVGSQKSLGRHVPEAGESRQARAFLVLSGLVSPIAAHERFFSSEPERYLSTFLGTYVLRAMAMAGAEACALDAIRKYWGGMLDFGATSFWEDFDLEWTREAGRIDEMPVPGKKDLHADFGRYCYKGLRHSLCHGWAGGPTAWLSEHILGVSPLAPGFAEASVDPKLAGLDWVEGTVPTPHGLIAVRAEKKSDGTTAVEIDKPSGVTLRAARSGANATLEKLNT